LFPPDRGPFLLPGLEFLINELETIFKLDFTYTRVADIVNITGTMTVFKLALEDKVKRVVAELALSRHSRKSGR